MSDDAFEALLKEYSEDFAEFVAHELSRLDGMLYGALTEQERVMVEEAVRRGLAAKRYEGAAGILGLSKVRVLTPDART